MKAPKGQKNLGGRPPKFPEARRPVTVTLPERTLNHLTSVDPDRAHAIVKVTEAAVMGGDGHRPPVELIQVAPGSALIVLAPCEALRRIRWLKLIEIAPARFLIAIPPGTNLESLEVEIADLLEAGALSARDQQCLFELEALMRKTRRAKKMSKVELLVVEIDD